jgi:hypothetical protein
MGFQTQLKCSNKYKKYFLIISVHGQQYNETSLPLTTEL